LERYEAQNVMMYCVNRVYGVMAARNGGDVTAGLAHDTDAWGALVRSASTIQSRRRAREKNYDVLLRRGRT
jgi:hypothetical protein